MSQRSYQRTALGFPIWGVLSIVAGMVLAVGAANGAHACDDMARVGSEQKAAPAAQAGRAPAQAGLNPYLLTPTWLAPQKEARKSWLMRDLVAPTAEASAPAMRKTIFNRD